LCELGDMTPSVRYLFDSNHTHLRLGERLQDAEGVVRFCVHMLVRLSVVSKCCKTSTHGVFSPALRSAIPGRRRSRAAAHTRARPSRRRLPAAPVPAPPQTTPRPRPESRTAPAAVKLEGSISAKILAVSSKRCNMIGARASSAADNASSSTRRSYSARWDRRKTKPARHFLKLYAHGYA